MPERGDVGSCLGAVVVMVLLFAAVVGGCIAMDGRDTPVSAPSAGPEEPGEGGSDDG